MPDLALEQEAGGIVCGIDEVGRGPFAGPVVAAAVILDPAHIPAGIRDSKKLSKARREVLHGEIMALAEAGRASVALGRAEVAEIDELNILHATMLAMKRAHEGLGREVDLALVDGNRAPDLPCPVRCVVKGDDISLSIAAASIVAKVTRDREMARLARDFPGYGWDKNQGYGTKEHRDGLARLGITPHHRRSFAPIKALENES